MMNLRTSALLFAGGVAINVAVSWSCMRNWSEWGNNTVVRKEPSAVVADRWGSKGSMLPDRVNGELRAFGLRGLSVIAEVDHDRRHRTILYEYWAQAGWPLRALEGSRWQEIRVTQLDLASTPTLVRNGWFEWALDIPDDRDPYPHSNFLPLRPVWPGTLLNSLLYALTLATILFTPLTIRRVTRSWQGRCPACGYPIDNSAVCTECGTTVTHTTQRRLTTRCS
jgi:hypothetical protein